MRALADAPSAFGATLAEWTGEGDTEQRWRQRLYDVPINLVAVDAGVPVGMLSVTAAVGGDHAEVISVWAAPEARGRGVGDALLRAAIASARARGDSRLTLKVRTANEDAVRLYRRAGFLDLGWATAPDAPHPERRMELDLRD